MDDKQDVKEMTTETQTDYDAIAQAHGNAAAAICKAIDAKLTELGDAAPPRLRDVRAWSAAGDYSEWFGRYKYPAPILAQEFVNCGAMDLYERLMRGEFRPQADERQRYAAQLAGGPTYGDEARKGRRMRRAQ